MLPIIIIVGSVIFIKNKYDEWIAIYKKVIEVNLLDTHYYKNYGTTIHNQNKYDKAITMYKKVT